MPTATLPSVSPAVATAGETLVAVRPFTWHGRQVRRGEVLDPQPDARKAQVMGRAGFVAALQGAVAQVQALKPDGLVCPECAKVLNHPTGLKVHRTRVHGRLNDGGPL